MPTKKGNLPHYNGDRIFGAIVAFWLLGMGLHLQTAIPLTPFERVFDVPKGWPEPTPQWALDNQWIPCLFTFLYFTMMIHGPTVMKDRPKPSWLKPVVFCWNIFLSTASSWGAWRISRDVLVAFRHEIANGGSFLSMWKKILCNAADTGDIETHRCNAYPFTCGWLMVFCMSKIPEMLDTLWLVLGKKQVIFLHWFHHASVMWFCWMAWGHGVPMGIAFALMNLTVHSLMYAWYALAAANNWIGTGLKPTRGFSQTVTILQILQMIAGTAITVAVKIAGYEKCQNHATVVNGALGMYSVYLILFIHFFIRAYCIKKDPLLKKPVFVADAHLLECARCGHKTRHTDCSQKPAGGEASTSSKKKRRKKKSQAQQQGQERKS